MWGTEEMQERRFPLNALQTHREGRGTREERSKQERIEGTGKERRRENCVFSHLGFLDERCVYVFGCVSFGLLHNMRVRVSGEAFGRHTSWWESCRQPRNSTKHKAILNECKSSVRSLHAFCKYMHVQIHANISSRLRPWNTHPLIFVSQKFTQRETIITNLQNDTYRRRRQPVIVSLWSTGVFPCHVISLLPTWLPKICRLNLTSSFWEQVVLYLFCILWFDLDHLSTCVCGLSRTLRSQIFILTHLKREHTMGLTWL